MAFAFCQWQEGVLHMRQKDEVPPAHVTVHSLSDHQARPGYKAIYQTLHDEVSRLASRCWMPVCRCGNHCAAS
jgi:hypothetical protein